MAVVGYTLLAFGILVALYGNLRVLVAA